MPAGSLYPWLSNTALESRPLWALVHRRPAVQVGPVHEFRHAVARGRGSTPGRYSPLRGADEIPIDHRDA